MKKLTKAQVEAQARFLWEEREACVEMLFGIKGKSWDDAIEPGRELMRKYARAGQKHWLDEPPYKIR